MDWQEAALRKVERMPKEARDIRDRAFNDLYYFACLVNPGYMYGAIHRDIFRWMQDYSLFGMGGENSRTNKLAMLPRGHLKSHMVATWCAWIITKHPEVTILYLSATAELAITQLFAIKNILGSTKYTRYFPEYINPEEGKREKWSAFKIAIDHPKRRSEGIRDATVATAGLTTNTTGWHADIIIADDIVVPENAYTEEGRDQVSKKASQFTSIRNAGGFTMACGTRYHPRDIYWTWANQLYEVYDELGELVETKPVWDIQEYVVEVDGVFTWPRVIRSDGKAFGFDKTVLSRIRAEYSDKVQFFAQYYNNPNENSDERISREKFQYYNLKYLTKEGDRWYYKGQKLNIYAAVDFAFSLNQKADYTAIVVIGVDPDSNIYVLDIDRFKTNKAFEYFKHIINLHAKWNFNKLRVEVTAAQQVIVESIKDFMRQEGQSINLEDYRPTRSEGSKQERIYAALEPKYENGRMWHCEGGWTAVLEDELVQSRPPHDDIKDALASAVSIAITPKKSVGSVISDFMSQSGAKKVNRFGGYY